MNRSGVVRVGVRLEGKAIAWVWVWHEFATVVLQPEGRAFESFTVQIRESPRFDSLLARCQVRMGRIGPREILILPQRRLSHFIRGTKEIVGELLHGDWDCPPAGGREAVRG